MPGIPVLHRSALPLTALPLSALPLTPPRYPPRIPRSCQDAFYGNAESVIGIYKDRARNSSQTLTLDLSPYPLAS